uniref:Secreted protein n=1 Tax=Arundo donax TaxID=35708 RepID=A0A0A9FZB3_ARUDO
MTHSLSCMVISFHPFLLWQPVCDRNENLENIYSKFLHVIKMTLFAQLRNVHGKVTVIPQSTSCRWLGPCNLTFSFCQ